LISGFCVTAHKRLCFVLARFSRAVASDHSAVSVSITKVNTLSSLVSACLSPMNLLPYDGIKMHSSVTVVGCPSVPSIDSSSDVPLFAAAHARATDISRQLKPRPIPDSVQRQRCGPRYEVRHRHRHTHTHTHTHTHRLTALCPDAVSGSGISWAIIFMLVCTSLQTTTLAPTAQFFTGRMPFLPPNQQRQSTEGSTQTCINTVIAVVSAVIYHLIFRFPVVKPVHSLYSI